MGQRVRDRYTDDGMGLTTKAVDAFALEADWDETLRAEVDAALGEGQASGRQILASEAAGGISAVEAHRQLMKLQAVEAQAVSRLLGEEEAKQFIVAVGIGGMNRRGVAGNRKGAGRAGRRLPGANPPE
jgi:hypothetical protein